MKRSALAQCSDCRIRRPLAEFDRTGPGEWAYYRCRDTEACIERLHTNASACKASGDVVVPCERCGEPLGCGTARDATKSHQLIVMATGVPGANVDAEAVERLGALRLERAPLHACEACAVLVLDALNQLGFCGGGL